MGYLSNNSDYYKQNTTVFQLKQQIASESGEYNQYLLISLLFRNSIVYKNANQTIYVSDHRAALSILFALPLALQSILAIYFYYLEKTLANTYKYPGYEQVLEILSPAESVLINANALNITVSPTSLSLLNDPLSPTSQDLIPNLFGYSPPLNNSPIEENLIKIFKHFNYNYPDSLLRLIKANSRRQALITICSAFNYSLQTQSNLLSILEVWELKNSNS